mmetsp:Transcript_20784/g.34257  ORF Transcript_20784/g.34257 Transcript_20784/m.34257 type:complete len:326 (+) Transcript_20784:54-1031(+)
MMRLLASACLASHVAGLAGRKSFFRQKIQPVESLKQLSAAELAFLNLISVSAEGPHAVCAQDVVQTYQRFGIVRIPHMISAAKADAIVNEATDLQPQQRNAYAQPEQADRYSLWLANSARSLIPSDSNSILHETMGNGELATCWRSLCSTLGASDIALAEVVTSCPGGAAQAWHQDGAGLTCQFSLCQIDLEQGPTEIRPRPFGAEYAVDFASRLSCTTAAHAAEALHKLQRPLYELTTVMHTAVWAALNGWITCEQATLGLQLSILPPPPRVRLIADVGMLTIYDSAMQHRGGANRGEYARPILAVHMRDDTSYSGSAVGRNAF